MERIDKVRKVKDRPNLVRAAFNAGIINIDDKGYHAALSRKNFIERLENQEQRLLALETIISKGFEAVLNKLKED